MKKLILFVALAIFVIANSNAQINFGAKAGVNFATITGDDVESFDGRTAFHVGVVAEIVISETFSFQPELLYSAQGADYSDDEFEGTFKLDYLNIPLMAKFYVGEGFSLEAGPQVGFLMSAKDEYDFTGTAFKSEEEDIKEFVKDIDFGINVGVGYKLEGGLNFGARYNLGLSDANDSGDDSFTLKNSVIQAYVGYFF
jgi:hypothetical protein